MRSLITAFITVYAFVVFVTTVSAGNDKLPVVGVSRNDTQEFIKWLNKRSDMKIRLPTEAEWEYTARSEGKKYQYSWGNGETIGNIAGETTKMTFPRRNVWEGTMMAIYLHLPLEVLNLMSLVCMI